jgi:uncharacterized membrane protein
VATAILLYFIVQLAIPALSMLSLKGSSTALSVYQLVYLLDENERKMFLSALRRLAAESNTSTRQGLEALLEELSVHLLRWGDALDRAYFTQTLYGNNERSVNQALDALFVESQCERAKYTYETVKNMDGIIRVYDPLQPLNQEGGLSNVVLTALVVTQGSVPLPATQPLTYASVMQCVKSLVENREQSKRTLRMLEVIWTPENEAEVLTQDELDTVWPNVLKL